MTMLEVRQDEAAPEATEAAPLRPVFPRGARVLIVDDVPENALLLSLRCQAFGLDYECVDSGRLAVEAARSGRFDVILMDIFMPGMDGMAASVAIRAMPGAVGETPIIAVTTAAGPGEVLRYRSCGMNDVVPKPINAARLAEALGDAFDQIKRSRRSGRRRAPVQTAA